LEFAQAACALGVDRGIDGFVRYSLLKRRGDSYIALPAGRFAVTQRRETDLVRELTPLLERVDSALRKPPASYESLRRQVDETIYQLLLRGGTETLRDLAVAVGRWHRWILNSAKPIRLTASLTTLWLEALAEIPEARIAGALASIWDSAAGGFRDHLDRSSRQYSWRGADLPGRLTRTLERRLLDSADTTHNPLRSRYLASAADACRFVDGAVDDDLIEDLLYTFSLIKWDRQPNAPPHENKVVWPVYCLLKHLFLPQPIAAPSGALLLRSDPRVLSLLSAGDIEGAADIALRRLQIAGLTPVRATYRGGIDPQRLAAALFIPVPYSAAIRSVCIR
jgi:CRISPR-associated protein Csx17